MGLTKCRECGEVESLNVDDGITCGWCGFKPTLIEKKEPVAEVPCSDRVMPAVCEWKKDEPYFGDARFFATECGEAYFFEEGTLDENNYNYCPNCGKSVKQA